MSGERRAALEAERQQVQVVEADVRGLFREALALAAAYPSVVEKYLESKRLSNCQCCKAYDLETGKEQSAYQQLEAVGFLLGADK